MITEKDIKEVVEDIKSKEVDKFNFTSFTIGLAIGLVVSGFIISTTLG